MIKKLILAICVLSLGCCSSNREKTISNISKKNSSESVTPLNQAVELIRLNNYEAAKKLLDEYVAARPDSWSPRLADDQQVKVFFWDKEQLGECGIFEIVAAGDKKMEPVMDSSYSKAY